jgi:hypothetical protein
VDIDRCPTCGWPTVKGHPCPRCSPESTAQAEEYAPSTRSAGRDRSRLAPGAPATPTASAAAATVIIALLVFIGLFWIVVAIMQTRAALAVGPGSVSLVIAIVGFWNLLVGGYTLSAIKGVVHRHLHAVGQLVLISVSGAAWALFATLWLGGWFQLLVVPLYIALGMLVWRDSSHFRFLSGSKKPPVRPLALTRDQRIKAVPPIRLPAPPSPPWEQPLRDTNQNDSMP